MTATNAFAGQARLALGWAAVGNTSPSARRWAWSATPGRPSFDSGDDWRAVSPCSAFFGRWRA